MRSHNNSAAVVELACLAISNIAGNSEDSQACLGELGACQAVARVLGTHMGVARAVGRGLRLVRDLAYTEGNRQRLGDAGVCALVVAALRTTHSIVPDVVELSERVRE